MPNISKLIWSYRILSYHKWLQRYKSLLPEKYYTEIREYIALFVEKHKEDPYEYDTIDSVIPCGVWSETCNYNKRFLDYERQRLAVSAGNTIILIGFLDDEDDKTAGYKLIRSGLISDCLHSENEKVTWYIDPHNDMRCAVKHGLLGSTNYLYRVVRDDVTPEQLKTFLSEILDGHIDRERIEAVTAPLGSKVRNAYKRGKLPFSLQEGR